MAGHYPDWRRRRDRERQRVRAVNQSGDRHRINALLAGGQPCDGCGAYGVRFSVELGARVCGECGHINRSPAA